MKRRILFGTGNQAKLDHLRVFLDSLHIEILSPDDVGVVLDVPENGNSPEENAALKACAYFEAARIPTFAIDAGLTIAKFPAEKQPGVFVRRIHSEGREASDAEMLAYYARALQEVGGESPGTWHVAITSMFAPDTILSSRYTLNVLMTAQPSPTLIPGAPLSSLMCDPITGVYYSEMPYADRPDSKWILEIMREHLQTFP